MTPFPVTLDDPGPRIVTSSPSKREPITLACVLCEHQYRGHTRYLPRVIGGAKRTLCNVFSVDVSEAMGAPLPRDTVANGLVEWLASPAGREAGWQMVDAEVAQRFADEGRPVFAVWHSRGQGPGHIAPLAPSMGEDGVWVSNVGASNFLRGTLGQAFGNKAVDFYANK